jgi:hypothetical protein
LLPYASIDLYVVSNKKYPLLGGSGWSLSDLRPDTCRALQAPFCPPLEQIYALKAFQPPKADTSLIEIPSLSFPHGVVLVVERTQESSLILPVSICITWLLVDAAMHSANHADSVARRLKAHAMKFENPFEAYENNHAECVLGLCCLVRFDSQVPAPDNPHYQRLCAIKFSLQASDNKVVYVYDSNVCRIERMSYQQSILVKSLFSFPHGIVFPFCLLDCIILAVVSRKKKESSERVLESTHSLLASLERD